MHKKENIQLPDSVYTPAELADLWSVTPSVIIKEISRGKLKAFSVGKSKRILGEEIAKYESQIVQGRGGPAFSTILQPI